jgi:hypothetical protein
LATTIGSFAALRPGERLREHWTLAGVVLGALDLDQDIDKFDALGVREALQHLLLRLQAEAALVKTSATRQWYIKRADLLGAASVVNATKTHCHGRRSNAHSCGRLDRGDK